MAHFLPLTYRDEGSGPVAGPDHQYICSPVCEPRVGVGISCDQWWFHFWTELVFASCRVPVSVQGLPGSSPASCTIPATCRGAFLGCRRLRTYTVMDLGDSFCSLFSPLLSVFCVFVPMHVSEHNLNWRKNTLQLFCKKGALNYVLPLMVGAAPRGPLRDSVGHTSEFCPQGPRKRVFLHRVLSLIG